MAMENAFRVFSTPAPFAGMNRLLLAGFASRQLLPYLPLPSLLSRPELSTPITNYNRRQSFSPLSLRSELTRLTGIVLEGYWLLDRSINPYKGGSFHHSPLLLLLSLLDLSRRPWLATFIWSLSEIATAAALARIAQFRHRGKLLQGETWLTPLFVAAAYVVHQYTRHSVSCTDTLVPPGSCSIRSRFLQRCQGRLSSSPIALLPWQSHQLSMVSLIVHRERCRLTRRTVNRIDVNDCILPLPRYSSLPLSDTPTTRHHTTSTPAQVDISLRTLHRCEPRFD